MLADAGVFDKFEEVGIFKFFPLFQDADIGFHFFLYVEAEYSEEELISFVFLPDPVLSGGDGLDDGVLF